MAQEQGAAAYGIRTGEREDLAEVAAIEGAVFPEPLALPELERLWTGPGTRYLVATGGGAVCAYFGFVVLGPVAHVISNATRPEHRRRGLAGRLLREGEAVAAAAGARWFLGEVRVSNRAQLALLAALGYRQVGWCPRFFGNGEDAHIVMRFFHEAAPVR